MTGEEKDDRKETTVVIGGLEHTLLLNEEDAKRYEDAGATGSKAKAPANKARS